VGQSRQARHVVGREGEKLGSSIVLSHFQIRLRSQSTESKLEGNPIF
jgi:hypothetical protein